MKTLIEIERRADVIRIAEDEGKYWAVKTRKEGESQKMRISKYEAIKIIRIIRDGSLYGCTIK